MKVDEDILKKDLLQLLSEMELFDYYRGSKKLHLNKSDIQFPRDNAIEACIHKQAYKYCPLQ